jgi:hypothetical protein
VDNRATRRPLGEIPGTNRTFALLGLRSNPCKQLLLRGRNPLTLLVA